MNNIWSSIRMLVVLTVLTGGVYPLAVTAIGQVVFPRQANGSLVERDGVVIGSTLIGQSVADPRYFQPRPSAIGYNPLPSGGSNQSATSLAWQQAVADRAAALRRENPGSNAAALPGDLVTASASGLDPHISPEAARLQIARIAAARGLDTAQRAELAALVERAVEPPQFGVLGEPRVNVLTLNLALDALQ